MYDDDNSSFFEPVFSAGSRVYRLKRRIVIQQFCYLIFIRYLIAKIAWVAVIVSLYHGIKHPEETSGRTIPLEALKKKTRDWNVTNPRMLLAFLLDPCFSSFSFFPSVSPWTGKHGSNRVAWNWHSLTNSPQTPSIKRTITLKIVCIRIHRVISGLLEIRKGNDLQRKWNLQALFFYIIG